jgi:hypothetical protein
MSCGMGMGPAASPPGRIGDPGPHATWYSPKGEMAMVTMNGYGLPMGVHANCRGQADNCLLQRFSAIHVRQWDNLPVLGRRLVRWVEVG